MNAASNPPDATGPSGANLPDAAPSVRIEIDDRRATLWLDRPPVNVLDLEALAALQKAFEALHARNDLQVLTIRGAGERAFSAGVAVEDHDPAFVDAMLGRFHGALRLLLDLPAVTIAAIDGYCLGGGLELAACCNLVIATRRSRLGQPEIRLGCFPPVAAALLPSIIGPGPAADLVLTGRTLTAEEAAQLGLVHRLVDDEDLDSSLDVLLGELMGHSAAVTRLATRALAAGDPRRPAFERALAEAERLYRDELTSTDDLREGVSAFLERRSPRWTHA
ncbi:MAG: enoyl-CoA hydratase/isomerase family protein [Acidobacteriota bacterium]